MDKKCFYTSRQLTLFVAMDKTYNYQHITDSNYILREVIEQKSFHIGFFKVK